MSEWGWVAFGYSVMWGSLAVYVGWIAYRVRRAKARLEELR